MFSAFIWQGSYKEHRVIGISIGQRKLIFWSSLLHFASGHTWGLYVFVCVNVYVCLFVFVYVCVSVCLLICLMYLGLSACVETFPKPKKYGAIDNVHCMISSLNFDKTMKNSLFECRKEFRFWQKDEIWTRLCPCPYIAWLCGKLG